MNGSPLAHDSLAGARILRHLRMLEAEFSSDLFLSAQTFNTFPTASGMASSASGFAALTLAAAACLSDAEGYDELLTKVDFSTLARWTRLGSGSACRSLLGGFVRWQKMGQVVQVASADDWNLSDVVVLIDPDQKKVSSSEGHLSADTSPFFELRKTILPSRLEKLEDALENKDFERLADLSEMDALEMHGIMLTGKPALRYFSAKSLELMNFARKLRLEEGLEVCFTLDAGPNVHLLCTKSSEQRLRTLLKNRYPNFSVFCDSVGRGPRLWKEESNEKFSADAADEGRPPSPSFPASEPQPGF